LSVIANAVVQSPCLWQRHWR